MSSSRRPKTADRTRQGRKGLDPDKAFTIRERLAEHVSRHYPSKAEFTRRIGVPPSTVTGWFGLPPHTPDVGQLVRLALEANISLNWLLLGEHPELLEATRSGERVATRFRQAVVNELVDRSVADRKEVEQLVASADHLFEATVNRYAEWIREKLPQYREIVALRKETEGWMIYEYEGEGEEQGGALRVRRRLTKELRHRRQVNARLREMEKDVK